MPRVTYEELFNELLRVLLKYGFRSDRAELCARLFADASRDGVYSHGLNRFPAFINYVQRGLVRVHAEPQFAESLGVVERWDGRLGPGNLNAWFCMDRAIHLARQNGMGCVALKNTNHWMRGGSYGWQAAEAGCIGICWTNTVFLMPPWEAKEPRLGNNPLIVAVPRPAGHVVLDMAMTQFSNGKLQLYSSRNELLPVEGGYDCEGRLTRDAKAILASRRPLPIGHWKGAGLALVLDLVAALLSGGLATHQISRLNAEHGVSQVFIAFDASHLASGVLAAQIADEIVDSVRSAAPATDNSQVLYPGERALMVRKENLEKGIPVETSFWEQVRKL